VLSGCVALVALCVSAAPRLQVWPGMPEVSGEGTRWRVLVAVDGRAAAPVISARGARVVVQRAEWAEEGQALFLAMVEQPGSGSGPELRVECGGARVRQELPLGIDLSTRPWEAWWAGADMHAAGVTRVPAPGEGTWTPRVVPRIWEDLGVTWLRTRVWIPEAWRAKPLILDIGAIDDADVTFVNGSRIGATTGWDTHRTYAIPPETIHWGGENEICIAVDNGFAGGGLTRLPLAIRASESPAPGTEPFSDSKRQREADRARPRALGPRLPLRPMVVRDGVLEYTDGGEVALWGVNIYPQSWVGFNTLQKLGVDHYRAIDEDMEDLSRMGIDIIRIHVFDREISDAQGNLVRNVHLDLLDYIAKHCNERGIYLMLTPIAWWDSPNGRPDSFSRSIPKEGLSMWEEARPIQRRYLRQFLTHRNPHTGRRLVDEPCLALFEVINEPVYWSLSDMTDPSTPPSPALEGVRAAWERATPDPAWRTPALFAYFRYHRVRGYIDDMIGAIRATGARQPIAYSSWAWQGPDLAAAVGDSRCDAVTMSDYPGGLGTINDGVNLLGTQADGDIDTRYASKARLVYEFDAPGTVTKVHMFPAMARRWRNLGVQVACQFQYDARAAAHVNWDWPQHYLNLWHTPGKAVSLMAAGEAFRRIPRGTECAVGEDDQVFGPAAVSFSRNTALLVAPDCYVQAAPTGWQPLPPPAFPRRVVSVGTCPYFAYEGTGVVDLRESGGELLLTICPDVDRVGEGWTGTVERPLTRLVEREHDFRLTRVGGTGARVERREGGRWVPVASDASSFAARPGEYRLRR